MFKHFGLKKYAGTLLRMFNRRKFQESLAPPWKYLHTTPCYLPLLWSCLALKHCPGTGTPVFQLPTPSFAVASDSTAISSITSTGGKGLSSFRTSFPWCHLCIRTWGAATNCNVTVSPPFFTFVGLQLHRLLWGLKKLHHHLLNGILCGSRNTSLFTEAKLSITS